MTVEELLKPRYKVIADYPTNAVPLGYIYTAVHKNATEYFNQYPAIFKRLDWWEERATEDIQQVAYLRTHAGNSVRQVNFINPYLQRVVFVGGASKHIKHWIPATEEEYLTFKNKGNEVEPKEDFDKIYKQQTLKQ